MKICIEGEPIGIAHDHDAFFTYVVTFSASPTGRQDRDKQQVIALVKAAVGEELLDWHQSPRQSGWQPYIEQVKPVSQTQWEVRIVYPYTD
jgi:hypothetical protein